MLETILLISVLGACWYAYSVGYKNGKTDVENAELKAMADSVNRAQKAKQSLSDPGVAQRVRDRFTRK